MILIAAFLVLTTGFTAVLNRRRFFLDMCTADVSSRANTGQEHNSCFGFSSMTTRRDKLVLVLVLRYSAYQSDPGLRSALNSF